MDNTQFGAFIAQLRKEQGLTQKELADKLNVTDKAVSKWETGKGFPDVKLLDPLAQALGVSLVELMQGKRQEADILTVAEADAAVFQALDRSERAVTRRYLRLFRWVLTGGGALALLWLLTTFLALCGRKFTKNSSFPPSAGPMGTLLSSPLPTPSTLWRPFSPWASPFFC